MGQVGFTTNGSNRACHHGLLHTIPHHIAENVSLPFRLFWLSFLSF